MKRRFICRLFLVLAVPAGVACSDKPEPAVTVGQQVFEKNCKVCHASGISGAPILGNRKMWEKRLPQGMDTLVSHAINGYGLMPPKGGNPSLTDDEVRNAVNYMVQHVK